jgi:adenosylhomocysteinase
VSSSHPTVTKVMRDVLRDGGNAMDDAAAEVHLSEVMDMSFANQALVVKRVWKGEKLDPKVYDIPKSMDENITLLKLRDK